MARRLDSRCLSGGILRLRELIEEHPTELAYDFRHRFQISIFEIGKSVTWLEAIMLVSVLVRDPNSWIQSAMSKWDYPVTREWIVLSHVFDLLAAVNSKKKPKPYPTPWPSDNSVKLGKKKQDRDKVISLLNRMNQKESDASE